MRVWVFKDGVEGSLATLFADRKGQLKELFEGSDLSRESVAVFYESSPDLPMKSALIEAFHIPKVTPELREIEQITQALRALLPPKKGLGEFQLKAKSLVESGPVPLEPVPFSPSKKDAKELEKPGNDDPKGRVLELVKKADYVFIGESHMVADEEIFVPMVEDFQKNGVKTLAVEIGTDQQEALSHFLKTGDSSHFSHPYDIVVEKEPGLIHLMQAAHKAGIQVTCVDMPFGEQPAHSIAERESYMGEQLLKRKGDGKTVMIVGAAHAGLDRVPYLSARSLVEESGAKTAGIKLESQAGIEVAKKTRFWDPVGLSAAFYTYFGDKDPEKTLAVPSSLLGGLLLTDPSPAKGKLDQRLSYAEAFNLVIFLPKDQARLLK